MQYLLSGLVSKNCEIWLINKNSVTDKKIIMFDDGDAFRNHVFFKII